MFEFANVGVDGVNWHGMSGCAYCPFSFGTQWSPFGTIFSLQQVNPIYYGMLMFQQATADGSSLLPVTVQAGGANVKVWATEDGNKTVRVVILNKDEGFAGNVTLTLPGHDSATATRLKAPTYESTSGITLAGQTLDGSLDGSLVGSVVSETIQSVNGSYTIAVSPTSAVLFTAPLGVNK
jgi:hypothetical protein